MTSNIQSNQFIQNSPIDTLNTIKQWCNVMGLVDFAGIKSEVSEDVSYVYHLFMQDVVVALDDAIKKMESTTSYK